MKNINDYSSVAKNIATSKKLPKSLKYDLYLREYDDMVEILGLVDDPTLDAKEFKGKDNMFPKKWVTLDILSVAEVEKYDARG